MTTPSEELANIIVERLVQAELVLPEDAAALARQLAGGEAQEADWRLALEKAQSRGTQR